MDNTTRNEVELRVAPLRKKYTDRELRDLFTGRKHDTLFSYIGEVVMAPMPPNYRHLHVWAGFELAVGNEYSVIAQDEHARRSSTRIENKDN